MESVNLISSDENEEQKTDDEQNDDELIGPRKIKQENERLRNTIRNLNFRIGTEIVDDDDDTVVLAPQYPRKINTLHYQNDHEFAKDIFFITNVSSFLEYSENIAT